MPIYEYTCQSCGKTFESRVGSTKEDAKQCPLCGADSPKRQLSTFAVSIGGSSGQSAPNPRCEGCPKGGCPNNPNGR